MPLNNKLFAKYQKIDGPFFSTPIDSVQSKKCYVKFLEKMTSLVIQKVKEDEEARVERGKLNVTPADLLP